MYWFLLFASANSIWARNRSSCNRNKAVASSSDFSRSAISLIVVAFSLSLRSFELPARLLLLREQLLQPQFLVFDALDDVLDRRRAS